MKFFTVATLMAIGAFAAPTVETRDISLSVGEIEAKNLITDMISKGEISLKVPEVSLNLEKRFGLLDCDRITAFSCLGTTAGALNSCFWAAITRGADIKDDAGCIAAATALGSNIPAPCKTCLHLS